MKIKLLNIIAFLLFFSPFFDMCMKVKEQEVVSSSASVDVDNVPLKIVQKQQEKLKLIKNTFIDDLNDWLIQKKEGFSGFDLCIFWLEMPTKKELSTIKLRDLGCLLFYFTASVIFVLLLVQLFLAFSDRYKPLFKVVIVNLCLTILLIPLGYNFWILHDINQIRWGYYSFLMSLLSLIIYHLITSTQQKISQFDR